MNVAPLLRTPARSRADRMHEVPIPGRRFVDVPPHRLFLRTVSPVAGRRELPVLCVHGLVVSSRYMVPYLEQLGREFVALAPDLPGFGESDKPARVLSLAEDADVLAALLDELGLRRTAVFGNSLGCQVAVELALRHPEKVAGLVLQGPTVDPQARSGWRQALRWIRGGIRERPAELPVLVKDYLDAGLRRATTSLHQALGDPIEEKLPKLSLPTLVVRGTKDALCTQRWAEQVTSLVPGARLVMIPGGPHTLNFSAPLELARVTLPFLRSLQ